MNLLALLLAQVELGTISIEEFRATLSEMKRLSLNGIRFGSGGAKDEVWITILEEMKKKDLLTLELLSLYYDQVYDRCNIQKRIREIFTSLTIEEEIGILFTVYGMANVALQEIIYTRLSGERQQDELFFMFDNTSSLNIQKGILQRLINDPAEILVHLFLATHHVEIQRIIAAQESIKNLDTTLISVLVANTEDQDTKERLLCMLTERENTNDSEIKLDNQTMEGLVDLFNETYDPCNREKIMSVITARISEMTPVLHILLIGNQTVRAQLIFLDMLIAGQIIDSRKRPESQIEKDIKDMQTEDLIELFAKIHNSDSPIRHLIGTELKKRLSV